MSKLDERPLELQQKIWTRLFEAARVAAMNKEERQAYIKHMNTERDIRNQIEFAIEKGYEEGMEKGIEKGIEKVARNLKKNKMPNEEIALNTGLTLEQIEAL